MYSSALLGNTCNTLRSVILIKTLFLCFQWKLTAQLFVQRNQHRIVDSLDGLWSFVREPDSCSGVGFTNKWFSSQLSTFENSTVMPVPAAYNDITDQIELRNHIGWVWYQTQYESPLLASSDGHIFLRFGSVNYVAFVFVNGALICKHIGGHVPFAVRNFAMYIKSSLIENFLP